MVERREGDRALIELVKEVHDDVIKMRGELSAHIAQEPEVTKAMIIEVVERSMSRAFPDGDPDGHRRAHEAAIAQAEARAAFWQKMLFEVTKYGLFGLLGWLAYHAWVAFLQGPHK